MIGSVLDAPREGFKFGWDIRNNGALLLDPACLPHLNVWSSIDLPYHEFDECFLKK
jgi:hypothetical protein